MEILKQGRQQKGRTVDVFCTGDGNGGGGCGAKLRVSEGDIYETFTHCRDETETYKTFRCPCCGVETDLDNEANAVAYHMNPKGTRITHDEGVAAYIEAYSAYTHSTRR